MKTLLIISLISALIVSFNSLCIIENPPDIVLNQKAVICIHLYKNSTVWFKSFAFQVNIDDFGALVINTLAAEINKQIPTADSINAVVQFQNTFDNQTVSMEIYNKAGLRYRDTLSFIIEINTGVFSKISLDNAKCDSLIGDDICFNDEDYSKAQNNQYGKSDPRFFFSWMGSDINKDHCISHARRLSRFSSFSAGSIYQDAKNTYNSV